MSGPSSSRSTMEASQVVWLMEVACNLYLVCDSMDVDLPTDDFPMSPRFREMHARRLRVDNGPLELSKR